MSTKSIPPVPPRPTRAHESTSGTMKTPKNLGDVPKIPPRPTDRQSNRSPSPIRERYAPSPLNEPYPEGHIRGRLPANNLSIDDLTTEAPQRPPSVLQMPSIGQEGNEYGEVFNASASESSPNQTRSVANDLKLHAPKPSLPAGSAQQRVSTVTRTDSDQAMAFGIGKGGNDDKEPHARHLKSKPSSGSQHSQYDSDRPVSQADFEHGIPVHGQRVPMYPNAGDVQAPSPAPNSTPYAPGIGFHNDGSKPRSGRRTTSGKGFEVPPGAYGLHGHGIIPHDRFEKAYYEKHPELVQKEMGQYGGAIGDGRKEWAMSSDDLNRIVRETAAGRGTSHGSSQLISTPSEQVGYQASDEYTSRMSSPHPQGSYHDKAHSNLSQTHVDSPLRKTSFPTVGKEEFEGTVARGLQAQSENALESEVETDDDVIHVDPARPKSRQMYGGAGAGESTDSLGVAAAMTSTEHLDEYVEEHGYSAPILAADEVAKEPFGYDLMPAVSPLQDRHGNYQEPESIYNLRNGSGTSLSGSRPSSRPVSVHTTGFGKERSAPLADVEEYEPLFPEEGKSEEKPLTAADRLKRPELRKQKFPSQDIWEDTPNSLQYTATVSTPQLPDEGGDSQAAAKSHEPREGETPAQAFARRQEALAESEARGSDSFLNKEKKPWAHKSHLVAETRPTMKQRFPSADIWEDTPDSLQLQTTVEHEQSEQDLLSPPSERPTTGAVAYHQEKQAAGLPLSAEEGRSTTGLKATMRPEIPERPSKLKSVDNSPENAPPVPQRPAQRSQMDGSSETPKGKPAIPERPSKPLVPARPTKPITRESSETVPLTKVESGSSAKSLGTDQSSTAAAKAKPPVPSRPVGGKIAALQGGFLSDLNKRLQLGPQAPKKEKEEEEPEAPKEVAPLSDARKSRARGPARRAPARTSAPASEASAGKPQTPQFSIITPMTVWHADPEDEEGLISTTFTHPASQAKAVQSDTPTLATNKEGDNVIESSTVAPGAESASPSPAAQDAHAIQAEEQQRQTLAASTDSQAEAPVKPSDSPAFESTADDQLAGSTETLKATSDQPVQTGEHVVQTDAGEEGAAKEEGDVEVKEPVEKESV